MIKTIFAIIFLVFVCSCDNKIKETTIIYDNILLKNVITELDAQKIPYTTKKNAIHYDIIYRDIVDDIFKQSYKISIPKFVFNELKMANKFEIFLNKNKIEYKRMMTDKKKYGFFMPKLDNNQNLSEMFARYITNEEQRNK